MEYIGHDLFYHSLVEKQIVAAWLFLVVVSSFYYLYDMIGTSYDSAEICELVGL